MISSLLPGNKQATQSLWGHSAVRVHFLSTNNQTDSSTCLSDPRGPFQSNLLYIPRAGASPGVALWWFSARQSSGLSVRVTLSASCLRRRARCHRSLRETVETLKWNVISRSAARHVAGSATMTPSASEFFHTADVTHAALIGHPQLNPTPKFAAIPFWPFSSCCFRIFTF